MGAASAAAAATASSFAHSSFTRPDGILAIDLGWGRLFAHASQVSVDKEAQKVADALKAKTKQEPVWVKHLVVSGRKKHEETRATWMLCAVCNAPTHCSCCLSPRFVVVVASSLHSR